MIEYLFLTPFHTANSIGFQLHIVISNFAYASALKGCPDFLPPFNHANTNTPNFLIAGSTGKLKSTTAEKKYQAPLMKKNKKKFSLLPSS